MKWLYQTVQITLQFNKEKHMFYLQSRTKLVHKLLGHLSHLCNWLFSAPQKKMLQNFYMIKKLEI